MKLEIFKFVVPKILLKIVTIILVLSALGLGLWLVNKNFPSSGQLEIKAALGQDQPAISRLGPPPRLKLENDYQLILEGPVYFDVRILSWFNQARIEIIYQESERKLIGLGGKVGNEWQYDIKEPLVITDLSDGFKQAIFEFDLNSLFRPKNITRFLIDTSGQSGQSLKIKEIKVTIFR